MCGPNSSGQWSPVAIAAAVFLNVGTLMFIIAVTSRPWIAGKDSRPDELEFGLFEACHREFETNIPDQNETQGELVFEKKCQSASDFVDIGEWESLTGLL